MARDTCLARGRPRRHPAAAAFCVVDFKYQVGAAVNNITVAPASYNGSTFTPPAISGTFTVPSFLTSREEVQGGSELHSRARRNQPRDQRQEGDRPFALGVDEQGDEAVIGASPAASRFSSADHEDQPPGVAVLAKGDHPRLRSTARTRTEGRRVGDRDLSEVRVLRKVEAVHDGAVLHSGPDRGDLDGVEGNQMDEAASCRRNDALLSLRVQEHLRETEVVARERAEVVVTVTAGVSSALAAIVCLTVVLVEDPEPEPELPHAPRPSDAASAAHGKTVSGPRRSCLERSRLRISSS